MSKKLIGILITAFILRLLTLDQSFWLDEAIGAVTVRNLDLYEVVINFPKGDNHPPLYYAALEIWSEIFGYSEIALRSLSVIFGTLSVLFVYKISLAIWNKQSSALVAALLTATSQFHLYYSQEARMYIMATLFATSAVYFFIKFIKEVKKLDLVLFSISITALVFTDYVPVLLVLIFPLYALFYNRDKLLSILLAHLPLALLGIFWLPIFLAQSRAGAEFLVALPAWQEIAGGATLRQALLVWTKFTLGRISFVDKSFYYTLLSVISIPFILSFISLFSSKIKKECKLLILWMLFPLVVGFLLSFIFPLFIYFRFTFVIPAFYLLLSQSRKIYIYTILAVNIFSLVVYFFYPVQQREDWKSAVKFIESNIQKNEIVIFANPEPFAQYRYYVSEDIEAKGMLDNVKIDPEKAEVKTIDNIKDKTGIYYFSYLQDLMDPSGVIKNTIESQEFMNESIYNFNGVGQIYYYRK